MARPSRCRRICLEPQYDRFIPDGLCESGTVLLTVDEYEAIRLIDLEKKTHEECANQMGISRTTVTEIYEKARYKIADFLVNGKQLNISGGNYRLCEGSFQQCCPGPCKRNSYNAVQPADYQKGASQMKIAVTYEGGNIFQHFGHTEQFKLYEIEDNKIVNTEIVDASGSGHGALAGVLSSLNVDILICGGIGGGAQSAISECGITLFGGVSGSADDAVLAYLAGKLQYNPDVHCEHHEHHEHTCGEHSCGEDHHGCAGNHNCQ